MSSRAVRRPYPDVSPPDTMLIRWRIGKTSFVTSWPATYASPDVGRRRVARILMSVVLPAPLGAGGGGSAPPRPRGRAAGGGGGGGGRFLWGPPSPPRGGAGGAPRPPPGVSAGPRGGPRRPPRP